PTGSQIRRRPRVLLTDFSTSFIDSLVDVKFPGRKPKQPEDLRSVTEEVVLDIIVGAKREIAAYFVFQLKDLQAFVQLFWTDKRCTTWKAMLTFHPENDVDHSAQAKAVDIFGMVRGMRDIHVHGAVPAADGYNLRCDMSFKISTFEEGMKKVEAFRTRASLHLNARVRRWYSRQVNWEDALSSFSRASELLKRYALKFLRAHPNKLDALRFFEPRPNKLDALEDDPDLDSFYDQRLMLMAEINGTKAMQPDEWISERKVRTLKQQLDDYMFTHQFDDHAMAVAEMHLSAIQLRLREDSEAESAALRAAALWPENQQIRKMKAKVLHLVHITARAGEDLDDGEPLRSMNAVGDWFSMYGDSENVVEAGNAENSE
ncbi:MAG: hypothetical protein Q9181_007670, partial [Wetmoreana brouardii]